MIGETTFRLVHSNRYCPWFLSVIFLKLYSNNTQSLPSHVESVMADEKKQLLILVSAQESAGTNEAEVKDENSELEEDMIDLLMKRWLLLIRYFYVSVCLMNLQEEVS